jgi:hypothetical protein
MENLKYFIKVYYFISSFMFYYLLYIITFLKDFSKILFYLCNGWKEFNQIFIVSYIN